MKHITLAACIKNSIEVDENMNEYKDGRPIGLGDMGSQTSLELRVIVRATQPIVTTYQVPMIQE